MSDLIKRETVLAFVRRCKDRLQGKGLTYDILVDYIESIPSAERKGEWIDTHKVYCGSTVFACSECKSEIDEIPTYYNEPMYKWCPYCGTHMKGAEDE